MDYDKKERHQLMDKFADGMISLAMVDRLVRISFGRIQQEITNVIEKDYSSEQYHHFSIYVGSQFEGMPEHVCSDQDIMRCKSEFPIVMWHSQAKVETFHCGYVFAKHNSEEPLYVNLKLVDDNVCLHEGLKNAFDNNGYMKTTDFKDYNSREMKEMGYEFTEQGPAFTGFSPTEFKEVDKLKSDQVYCCKCQSWPPSTNEFFTRERQTNWPPQELLRKLARLDCFVVPIGHHSSLKDIEWRLSFSVAEKELIHSMPDSYVNSMFALKAIHKSYIKYDDSVTPTPFCSYFIKTACLWMCETIPHNDSIMDLIREILDWLDKCYREQKLPHYFIREQNLISHLSKKRCKDVRSKLTATKNDLWKRVMSSIDGGESNKSVNKSAINHIANKLEMDKVNDANDYKLLETKLLKQPPAVLKKFTKVLENNKCKYGMYYIINKWLIIDFENFFDAIKITVDKNLPPSEILERPKAIMMPIIKSIKQIVLEVNGHGEMFTTRLYRYVGDMYTYLLLCFQSQFSSAYRRLPLDYYKLGAEMVLPNGWSDKKIGGLSLEAKYHYLMGDYESLKPLLESIEKLIPSNTKERHCTLSNLTFISIHPDILKKGSSDDELLQLLLDYAYFKKVYLHPFAFVHYMKARISLTEGNMDVANNVDAMKEVLSQDMPNPIIMHTTNTLIKIIESLKGLLTVMKMVLNNEII
ncbi:uncharacterized protein LOC117099901 [Anneissia japonica]|uniref:uncharacterized protein LOC117099901 n=1 Tax=Anneissia japonica TaxID=1529436 RepID=UPI0014258232|nr:uncharacterized protein LOC117099901 [Anneissia japonica]